GHDGPGSGEAATIFQEPDWERIRDEGAPSGRAPAAQYRASFALDLSLERSASSWRLRSHCQLLVATTRLGGDLRRAVDGGKVPAFARRLRRSLSSVCAARPASG